MISLMSIYILVELKHSAMVYFTFETKLFRSSKRILNNIEECI